MVCVVVFASKNKHVVMCVHILYYTHAKGNSTAFVLIKFVYDISLNIILAMHLYISFC